MLDDLRQQAEDSFRDEPAEAPPAAPPPRRFLGMTPAQTFVILLILFVLTCVLSTACLLVSGRVVPPFL